MDKKKLTKGKFSRALKTRYRCLRSTLINFSAPLNLTIIRLIDRYALSAHMIHIIQECFVFMKVGDGDGETMRLVPKEVEMLQDLDLTLFKIEWWNLDYNDKTDQSTGIWMRITLKRKIMSEMMTTYLPSILLMLITFATTFFKPIYFEAALTVNLTTMLVMTTIFISVMERLHTKVSK